MNTPSPLDREYGYAAGALGLVSVLLAGFVVHQSERFAGSATGGAFGVAAALLMSVPLAYSVLRRTSRLRQALAARLPLSRALALHAYAGLAGAVLAIVHTGHRFESWLGLLLTIAMLASVVSGFAGRYLLRQLAQTLRERQTQLQLLLERAQAPAVRTEWQATATHGASLWAHGRGLLARAVIDAPASAPPSALELAASIAELEHEIGAQERFRHGLGAWLVVHLAVSIAFYALLVAHVANGVVYGLRWFD